MAKTLLQTVDEFADQSGVSGPCQREPFRADLRGDIEVPKSSRKSERVTFCPRVSSLTRSYVLLTLVAENRLDRLAECLWGVIRSLVHHLLVWNQLLQTILKFPVTEQTVCERCTDVPFHR